MSDVQMRERRLRVRARRHDARAIAICIEDTGGGLPPQDAGSGFEPFFMDTSYRTRLGLAVCRTIASAGAIGRR